MMTPKVESNSIETTENTTPKIDVIQCDSTYYESKADINVVDGNNDNNEWIDIGRFQTCLQSDDVTLVEQTQIKEHIEEISQQPCHEDHENTQSYQDGVLKAILLTNCTENTTIENNENVETSKPGEGIHMSTLKQTEVNEDEIINIEDSEDEMKEDDAVEWMNANPQENTNTMKVTSSTTNMQSTTTPMEETLLYKLLETNKMRTEKKKQKLAANLKKIQSNEDNSLQTFFDATTVSVLKTLLQQKLFPPTPKKIVEVLEQTVKRKENRNTSSGKKKEKRNTSSGKKKQTEPAVIIIEDSDKDDNEDTVEEKIEIEDNFLDPGVQCGLGRANQYNAVDASIGQSTSSNFTKQTKNRSRTKHEKTNTRNVQTSIGKNKEVSSTHSLNGKVKQTTPRRRKKKEKKRTLVFHHSHEKYGVTVENKRQTANYLSESSRDTSNLYKCHLCQYTTTINLHFQVHLKSERHKDMVDGKQDGASVPLYKCHPCNYTTKKKFDFQLHVEQRIHQYMVQKMSNPKYQCKICTYVTKSKETIDFHFQSRYHIDRVIASATNSVEETQKQNDPKKVYRCNYCYCYVISEMDLDIHIWKKHMTSGKLVEQECFMCNFATQSKYLLERHFKYGHGATGTKVSKHIQCKIPVDKIIEEMSNAKAENKQTADNVVWTETEVIINEDESECAPPISTGYSADWAEIEVEEDTMECEDYI